MFPKAIKYIFASQGVKFIRVNSLLRAAKSGSEGYAVLFFHSPLPSVTHFLLQLHDQFNFLSGCAV